MKKTRKHIFKSKFAIILVVIIVILASSAVVVAATTIGLNITTDGQVGIGTGATALMSKLDIGNWTSGGAVHLGDNYTGAGDIWGGTLPALVISDGGSNRSSFYINGGATYLGAETISDVHLMKGNLPGLTLSSLGNVGIGTSTPSQALEVNGGIRYNTIASIPPLCNASTRGTTWFTQGIPGFADIFEVCAKDAANNYAWRSIY